MVGSSPAQQDTLTEQDARRYGRRRDHHPVGGSGPPALDEPVDEDVGARGRRRALDRGPPRRPLRINGQAHPWPEGPRTDPARSRWTPRPRRRAALRPADHVLPQPHPQTRLTMSTSRRSVALLGATGSIGTQTLDVLRREPDAFELVSIAGGEHLSELAAIAREFRVKRIGVVTDDHRAVLADLVNHDVEIVVGPEGLADLSRRADIIVNAVMGFAGLPVTLAALESGKRLALANKESLIAAAPLVAKVRTTPGATLLPIDS